MPVIVCQKIDRFKKLRPSVENYFHSFYFEVCACAIVFFIHSGQVVQRKSDSIWSYGVDIADFAAGSLIAQEGGALVSNFNGDPKFLDGNNIICATAKTYKSILKSVKPYFKD